MKSRSEQSTNTEQPLQNCVQFDHMKLDSPESVFFVHTTNLPVISFTSSAQAHSWTDCCRFPYWPAACLGRGNLVTASRKRFGILLHCHTPSQQKGSSKTEGIIVCRPPHKAWVQHHKSQKKEITNNWGLQFTGLMQWRASRSVLWKPTPRCISCTSWVANLHVSSKSRVLFSPEIQFSLGQSSAMHSEMEWDIGTDFLCQTTKQLWSCCS